jgi:hypothetical protein
MRAAARHGIEREAFRNGAPSTGSARSNSGRQALVAGATLTMSDVGTIATASHVVTTTRPSHMIIELALAFALHASVAQTAPVVAQENRAANSESEERAFPERIVWFTQLDEALAEAARTNRPILVHSASPSCSGAPGMW